METFNFPANNRPMILALGAESAGNFSVFYKGKIYFSEDLGDLLEDTNWEKYNSALNGFFKKHKIKPKIIITDLHPLYKTTLLGQKLAKKYKAKHIQVQHHLAHIFSAIGEQKILNTKYQIPNTILGIALDGTGYGLDGKIWGGEILEVKSVKRKLKSIKRIGHLENQIMIGGDLAVREPARMLIGILDKFLPKDKIYKCVKKYYSRNQFEVLYNQLQSGFNCQETSSTGRTLDAVSMLLGFARNKRSYKHEPAILLEQNSTISYSDLKPRIKKAGNVYELLATPLFEYLIKNIHKDKKRLATTAQLYIAQGVYKILKKQEAINKKQIFLSGGISNNKIISEYLILKGAIVNNTIPCGDAGISFGQIIYYLTNSWD